MFCPICKAEYEKDIQVCADCNVSLVKTLPEETHEAEFEYEKLLQTYNQADLGIIKSILDDAEMTYYVEGENFLGVGPMIQPVIVFIRSDQVEDAKVLLKDVEMNYWGGSVHEPEKDEE